MKSLFTNFCCKQTPMSEKAIPYVTAKKSKITHMKNFLLLFLTIASFMVVSCQKEAPQEALPALMATTTFNIEGMHCEVGCAARIQKKLAKLDGVENASIDFDEKLATVEHDLNKQKPEDLVALVLKIDNTYVVSNENTISE